MIIWGQCSESVQAKLRTITGFSKVEKYRDCLVLLKEINAIAFKFESQRYPCEASFDALTGWYQMRQHRHQSNLDYLTKFKNMINILNHYNISIGEDPLLVNYVANLNPPAGQAFQDLKRGTVKFEALLPTVRNRFIAYSFLRDSCTHRYRKLLHSLSNQFTMGNNQYPNNLTTAYGMLINYKSDSKKKQSSPNDDSSQTESEMSFLNAGDEDDSDKLNNDDGYSSSSDNSTTTDVNHTSAISLLIAAADSEPLGSSLDVTDFEAVDEYFEFSFMNAQDVTESDIVPIIKKELSANFDHLNNKLALLNPNWILLDNQSTVHIFRTQSLVSDIQAVTTGDALTCHSNGGSQRTVRKAIFSFI